MAIYSELFNVGIGGGALLGSIIAARYGVVENGNWASILVLLATVPLFYLLKARRQEMAH